MSTTAIVVLVVAAALQGGGIGEAVLEDFCGRMAVAGVSLILTHSYLPGFFLRRDRGGYPGSHTGAAEG